MQCAGVFVPSVITHSVCVYQVWTVPESEESLLSEIETGARGGACSQWWHSVTNTYAVRGDGADFMGM